ncbi:TraR/DksA family transcriptional regulator [Aeromicrobium sp. SMF47]|uniref:TraR/DksA family transcriptional regulator n=1 Tax=Aeromicrobium yanjiei TaxID=2662028 RepID=A0A5Q2MAE0_9ACTN|nr:TraR/DksA C4-type zinc finger protein [Aeromicrobium yanjiei]MRJ75514.1 TraR/DksA family transcriptional regulator [Aeromicrobium yanjiei]QGG40067.1 TraR/DksA family transcriptional regulator [Aeromicrobium yanjiei]
MSAELQQPAPSPWTADELDSIREGLESAVLRIEAELALIGSDLGTTAGAPPLEVLVDDLDVASQRAEMLQDAVQAENLAAILAQTQHVLDRLSAGHYGVCESCAGGIGRPRLEAFPRATLCIGCAH